MSDINETTSNNIKNIASRITITNTINQLKKFGLFDEFKNVIKLKLKISKNDDYQMSGEEFRVVKSYNENLDEVTDISFSCFKGMTPKQILDILNEVK